jgi:hypothetical protein
MLTLTPSVTPTRISGANLRPWIYNLDPWWVIRTYRTQPLSFKVTGVNFVPGSVVRWNAMDQATHFMDERRLVAIIPLEELDKTSMARVSVFNPAPGGGESNTLSFIVIGGLTPTPGATDVPVPTQTRTPTFAVTPSSTPTFGPTPTRTPTRTPNPTFTPEYEGRPEILDLRPRWIVAGGNGEPLMLKVKGLNFVKSSVVQWNGADMETEFVDRRNLIAIIPTSELQEAGTAQITVKNPPPDNLISAARFFRIVLSE